MRSSPRQHHVRAGYTGGRTSALGWRRAPGVRTVGGPHLVEVGNDLVEEAQALHPHVVTVQLDVEVVEVGDGGKHDPHLRVGLVVQVLGVKGWVSHWHPQGGRSGMQGWPWGRTDGPRGPGPETWLEPMAAGHSGTPSHTRRGSEDLG